MSRKQTETQRHAEREREQEERSAPPFGQWEVMATGWGNPYTSGPMQIRIEADGIRFRWLGEEEWSEAFEWHQLAWVSEIRNERLRDDLKFIREDAHDKGYTEGLEESQKAWRLRMQIGAVIARMIAEHKTVGTCVCVKNHPRSLTKPNCPFCLGVGKVHVCAPCEGAGLRDGAICNTCGGSGSRTPAAVKAEQERIKGIEADSGTKEKGHWE